MPCVAVKLGGGLITRKSSLCAPDAAAIEDLAAAIHEVHAAGTDVIVVHGAGSFGHLKAKQFKLQCGKVEEGFPLEAPVFGLRTQEEAVAAVRQDMLALSALVAGSLERHGLECRVHPPHQVGFTGIGPDFDGDVAGRFALAEGDRTVAITFGDVVECPAPRHFGILSGDDLLLRIATEVPGVARAVFAVQGVDGLLRSPPQDGVDQDLVEDWRPGDVFCGAHDASVDVTGGIFLKMERAGRMAQRGRPVTLVRGIRPRVVAACLGDRVRGTQVRPAQPTAAGPSGGV